MRAETVHNAIGALAALYTELLDELMQADAQKSALLKAALEGQTKLKAEVAERDGAIEELKKELDELLSENARLRDLPDPLRDDDADGR